MKKLIGLILALFILNCSGTPLTTGAQTSTNSTLKTVTVMSTHHPMKVDGAYPNLTLDDGTKMFTNNLGITIHLTEALLSWGSLDIITEGSLEDCLAGDDQSIALNVVEDIITDDLFTKTLGSQNIPNQSYCQYQITFSAANESFNALASSENIFGRSVYLKGTWSTETESNDFEIAITDDFTKSNVFYVMEGEETIEHPLHFEDESSATVLFGNMYNTWFNDIDFTESESDIREQVIANIQGHVHQHLGSHHGSSDQTDDMSSTDMDSSMHSH